MAEARSGRSNAILVANDAGASHRDQQSQRGITVSNPHGRPKGSKNDPAKAVRLPFRQSEIMRGIRAMAAMNLPIESIVIKDGTVTITPAKPLPAKREKAEA